MRYSTLKYTKIVCIALIAISFIACKNNKDEKLYEEMSEGLQKSNIQMQILCRNYLSDFNIKMSKAETEERTAIWLPKAEKAKQLSDELLAYINSNFYQDDIILKVNDEQIIQLYQKLIEYRTAILSIDSTIKKESIIPSITCEKNSGKEVSKTDFISSFKLNSRLIIIGLINRINRIESCAIGWCNKELEVTDESFYYSFQAIASQNSEHFKPNGKLRITAGIGSFSLKPKLSVTIDGVPIKLNVEGVAEYETSVGSKIGKHSKMVKISYTKPNGIPMLAEREIVYTVDE